MEEEKFLAALQTKEQTDGYFDTYLEYPQHIDSNNT